MRSEFAQMADSKTWALSLEGFIGEDKLREAMESGDPAVYRKNINSLALVGAIRDALDHDKNIVLFTTTLADNPEKQSTHMDKILAGLGFLPLQMEPLKDNMVAEEDHKIVPALKRYDNQGVTFIANSAAQLAEAPEHWKSVRILPQGTQGEDGIKNPDWLMFFMTQELIRQTRAANASTPSAPAA